MVGLDQGPLSLVSAIEELLERKSSGPFLETEIMARGDQLRSLCDTFLSTKVATNFAKSGGHSVSIVPSWTQATELVLFLFYAEVNECDEFYGVLQT
jgi:hypothetical protein